MVIEVIKKHCMEEKLQHEMREAVKQRADIMWLQNDCIYNAFVRPSLSAETSVGPTPKPTAAMLAWCHSSFAVTAPSGTE